MISETKFSDTKKTIETKEYQIDDLTKENERLKKDLTVSKQNQTDFNENLPDDKHGTSTLNSTSITSNLSILLSPESISHPATPSTMTSILYQGFPQTLSSEIYNEKVMRRSAMDNRTTHTMFERDGWKTHRYEDQLKLP